MNSLRLKSAVRVHDLAKPEKQSAKALADRLAEAFAKCRHKHARAEQGDGRNERFIPRRIDSRNILWQSRRPGYPAQPDHTEKLLIFDPLPVVETTGITLAESSGMYPAVSMSGLYFARSESQYFAVRSIGKKYVESYATRKGTRVSEVERRLSPIPGFDPAKS